MRSYRLGKRAEKQQETRRRIVEAALELHGRLGPARTSIAQIAERAGVQRHTFYAHFPDDRSLLMACSDMAIGRDPLPLVEEWAALAPGLTRLAHGLEKIYAWYERNEELMASVLRDAEFHDLTREIVEIRMNPVFARGLELLGEGLSKRARTLLRVAYEFSSWRVLARTHRACPAAALMAEAILSPDP